MDFGDAIRAMNAGCKVARVGWNGKDMWVCLSGLDGPRRIPAAAFWSQHGREHAESQGGFAVVLPCFLMKNARGEIVMGWLANQEDMQARDWEIV